MDWKGIQEKVTVGVISAVFLGVLAITWNFASEGGLIRLLGGVPEKDLNPKLALLNKRLEATATKDELEALSAPQPAAQSLERGAVVAFDLPNGCPVGWTEFTDAAGRLIIGKGDGIDLRTGKSLSGRNYRDHGGEEEHKLTEEEMPKHRHKTTRDYAFLFYLGEGAIDLSSLTVRKVSLPSRITDLGAARTDESRSTDFTGGGQPHNNMPPFIALYFCKKN